MNIETIKEKLKPVFYWDMSILDVQTQYFLDELYIYIEIDKECCWKVSFLSCYKVNYETDASWRGDYKVKDFGPNAGYYGQDSFVKKYPENNDFLEFSIDLTIILMTIVCKDVHVEKVSRRNTHFYWEK